MVLHMPWLLGAPDNEGARLIEVVDGAYGCMLGTH